MTKITVEHRKPQRMPKSQRDQKFAYWQSFEMKNGSTAVGFTFSNNVPVGQKTYMVFPSYDEGVEYATEVFMSCTDRDPSFYAYKVVKR